MLKPQTTEIHWFIDTFESLVDLFTLLSFTLIIAALIYGTQSFHSDAVEVEIATVAPGSYASIEIPENVIVLMLRCIGPENRLYIIKPDHQTENYSVDAANIKGILRSEVVQWNEKTEINVAIEHSNMERLAQIHMVIMDLFDQFKIKKHFHYFF